MDRLLWTDRKESVIFEITTNYNQVTQKSISEHKTYDGLWQQKPTPSVNPFS